MSESRGVANQLIEHFALRPDLGRALRAGLALSVPLITCHLMGRPDDGVFIAMAAQTVALPDVRGAYLMRLAILVSMTIAMAAAAMLGVYVGHSIFASTVAMGFIALLGGLYRHLSADYGPPLGVSSALVFLLGLGLSGSLPAPTHLAGLILIGGLGASALQISFWLFRPQHPLRYAVAESWVAASDLVASMREDIGTGPPSDHDAITNRERDLRATLDRTFVILGAAESKRRSPLIVHLEELRLEVVHYTMRALALHTSLESLLPHPNFSRHLPALDSVLKALSDAARSVAITLVTHRATNFTASQIRLQRCRHLIQVFSDQLTGSALPEFATAQMRASLDRITEILPAIEEKLGETIEQSASPFGIRTRLPDLSARSMQSLAAWINPEQNIDPVLVKYSLRMAVLTMIAVALYKGLQIPRGYWIAFTIAVVLQPDFGSTRQRAGERIGGTLVGSLLGSALLWIKMPLFLLDALAGLMATGFAYYLKRSYGVAVFFVTLMLVLITETTMTVHLDFTISRLLCNLAGGTVALISAMFFWPAWEGQKLTSLLSAAILSNRAYLESIAAWLKKPGADDLLMAKRRAENANRFAGASLQRMLTEPHNRNKNSDCLVALCTYNQRITRALTAAAVHLDEHDIKGGAKLATSALEIAGTLAVLADAVEPDNTTALSDSAALTEELVSLDSAFSNEDRSSYCNEGKDSKGLLIWTHLSKAVLEVHAMAVALKSSSPSV